MQGRPVKDVVAPVVNDAEDKNASSVSQTTATKVETREELNKEVEIATKEGETESKQEEIDRNNNSNIKAGSGISVQEVHDISSKEQAGSNHPMGDPKMFLTPNDPHELPVLSDFDRYPSLVATRQDSPCILIGFDSEWVTNADGEREVLSWQFSIVNGDKLVELVIISKYPGDQVLTNRDGFRLCFGLFRRRIP